MILKKIKNLLKAFPGYLMNYKRRKTDYKNLKSSLRINLRF